MNSEFSGEPSMERKNGTPTPLPLRILVALAIFAVTCFAAMMAVGVYSYFIPRQYYSKVTMEVNPDSWGSFFNPVDPTSKTTRNTNLQPTVFQILQSKEILYLVIDHLKLVEAWSAQEDASIPPKKEVLPKEEVYSRLLGRIMLTSVRNTNLIEIGAYSTDRHEAANIANMIAVVYQRVIRDGRMQIREAALAQLREETQAQQKKVIQAQTKIRELREKEGIVDPNPEELSASVSGISDPQLKEKYINIKADYLNSKRLQEEFAKRLATESVQLKMAVIPAKIWEKAEPAIYPAKPNMEVLQLQALTAGTILGLVLAGIYLLFASRPRNPATTL